MKVSVSQSTDRPRGVLYTVAALSLLAALIHLWVTPEHFEEWWGYVCPTPALTAPQTATSCRWRAFMQVAASVLPRIQIPRIPVNNDTMLCDHREPVYLTHKATPVSIASRLM
jgi:hypothetical protein